MSRSRSTARCSRSGSYTISTRTLDPEFCKWFAHGKDPIIHAFDCSLTAETHYYFRIVEDGSSSSAAYFLDQCGTDDTYSNCTEKWISSGVYESSQALDMEEAGYGRNCQSELMGTSADPANIGTPDDPLQGLIPGGNWVARDLLHYYQVSAQCGHYKFNSVTDKATDNHLSMGYYDERN